MQPNKHMLQFRFVSGLYFPMNDQHFLTPGKPNAIANHPHGGRAEFQLLMDNTWDNHLILVIYR